MHFVSSLQRNEQIIKLGALRHGMGTKKSRAGREADRALKKARVGGHETETGSGSEKEKGG